jgi:hypothetical protein
LRGVVFDAFLAAVDDPDDAAVDDWDDGDGRAESLAVLGANGTTEGPSEYR